MALPTVSVVMPNYNHAAYLPSAIEQILGQSHPPDEFLILDDASTDNSRAIIESYAAKHACIRGIYQTQNLGVNEAHRKLFLETRGDYVYAGAADDIRLPRFLERTLELAARFPNAGLISTQLAIGDAEGQETGAIGIRQWREPVYADPERVLREYLDVESPSHSLCTATVYRRSALQEVGWYQTELESWGDTFSARAIALKSGMCHVPEKLAMWRRLDDSFSSRARQDGVKAIELVSQAARKMRSEPFREVFPESHIQSWERRYRQLIVFSQWMGEGRGLQWRRPGFWARGVLRLPALVQGLALLRRVPASTPSSDQA